MNRTVRKTLCSGIETSFFHGKVKVASGDLPAVKEKDESRKSEKDKSRHQAGLLAISNGNQTVV